MWTVCEHNMRLTCGHNLWELGSNKPNLKGTILKMHATDFFKLYVYPGKYLVVCGHNVKKFNTYERHLKHVIN